MSSSGGDSNVFTTILSGEGSGGGSWQIIIALLASSVGFVVALVNAVAAYFRDKKQMEELAAQERRFEAFKKELEDKQRRLVRYENVQELMKQYKKPLLQSAFDLQSRLANQVKSNFLYTFAHKGNERDREYAMLNMAFVVAELLGWLEVIRQEIVFIVGGGNRTADLNLVIDAIKFQFTGETACQGNPGNVEANKGHKDYDEHWQILQLYAGELRAIGEVMLVEKLDGDGVGSNLSVIGYAEFVRRCNAKEPDGGSAEEMAGWRASKDKLQQETLRPLMNWIGKLVELDSGCTPKKRMAMLQVLLCKLIDVLDEAVPFEIGPEYNLEDGEEPRYISRDFRLTPVVGLLSLPQKKWLASQRFMEKVHAVDRLAWTDWWGRLCELPKEEQDLYSKLSFPGFREDMHTTEGRLTTQAEREKKADTWPGAFPPRQPRVREPWWWAALTTKDYEHWYNEAHSKGRIGAPPSGLNRMGSVRFGPGTKGGAGSPQQQQPQQSAGGWSWSFIRKRKGANTKVEPDPSEYEYTRPAILTAQSVHQLRFAGSTADSPAPSRRDMTPVHTVNSNPRTTADL